jgi:hypothetical protein
MGKLRWGILSAGRNARRSAGGSESSEQDARANEADRGDQAERKLANDVSARVARLDLPEEPSVGSPSSAGDRAALASEGSWLSQGIFQSILIIISILIALAFDEWREEAEEGELVNRAIYSFEQEIRHNNDSIGEVIPFHNALFEILWRNRSEGKITEISQVNDIVQGFQTARLEHTAWDTAVATGALAKMDYELVNALSLTYSLQQRYLEEHEARVLALESVRVQPADVATLTNQAVKRVQKVIEASSELKAVYDEALELIGPMAAPPDG